MPQVKPHAILLVDTEFNGPDGALISIALVDAFSGKQFYREFELEPSVVLVPWVAENVIPMLYAEPFHPQLVLAELTVFLYQFGFVEFVYNAHQDERYLVQLLEHIHEPPMYRLSRDGHISARAAEHPHNALSDALAMLPYVIGASALEFGGVLSEHAVIQHIRQVHGIPVDMRDIKLRYIATLMNGDVVIGMRHRHSDKRARGESSFVITPPK